MDKRVVIAAVAEWAQEVAPALADRAYGYVPGAKPKGLPDVVVELQQETVVPSDPDFPITDLQQIPALRVWTLQLSVMAGALPTDPDDEDAVDIAHAAATATLHDISSLLGDALIADETLGRRVPMASPFHVFDFTRPFVEYDDGTRGREMRMAMKVAEPLIVTD